MLLGSSFVDALVLFAVWLGEREDEGAWIPLWRILFWADAMHRFILERAEIEHAVRRLVPADLLALSLDGEFALTPAGRELVASCVSPDRNPREAMQELERKLPDVQAASTWSLPEDAFERAVDEYHTWFRAALRKLDEQEAAEKEGRSREDSPLPPAE